MSSSNKRLITGDDWNDYFRSKHGYDNVNWESAFNSPNDIIDVPSLVSRMNPSGLKDYLNRNGLEVSPLGRGRHADVPFESGGGYNVHFDGQNIYNIIHQVAIMQRCLTIKFHQV